MKSAVNRQYVRLFKEPAPLIEDAKPKDTYSRKLAFAKSLGYRNLAEAMGKHEDFEDQFEASQKPKKRNKK